MDDIFSTHKDDQEPKSDANFDWKKGGIDKNERITLKVDVREANAYNAKKKNDTTKKIKAPSPTEVPSGFKKISKKIRDSFDEDEDEDECILVPVFLDRGEGSIIKSLSNDERRMLEQRLNSPDIENINLVRMHQTASREAVIEQAERILDKAGIAREVDNRALHDKRTKSSDIDLKEVMLTSVKQPQKQKIEKILDKPMSSSFEKEVIKIKNIDEKELAKTIKQADEKQRHEAAQEKKLAQESLRKEENQKERVVKEENKQQTQSENLNKQKAEEILQNASKKDVLEASKQAEKEGATSPEEKTHRTKELLLEKSGRYNASRENLPKESKEPKIFDEKLQKQIEEQKRAQNSQGK